LVTGSLLLGSGLALASLARQVVVPTANFTLLLAIVLAFLALDEAGLIVLPHPQRRAQVRRELPRTAGPTHGAFLFGLVLGSGVLTVIASATLYGAIFAAILIRPDAAPVAAIGFGLGRAAPVALLSGRLSNSAKMDGVVRGLTRLRPWMHRAEAATLAAMSSALFLASQSRPWGRPPAP
jgi:hypothetical protein